MNKKRTLEILRDTRKLLEDPSRWCGGRWAKDSEGNGCMPTDPHASCWCLEGALRRIMVGYADAVIALNEHCITKKNDELYAQGDHKGLLAWLDQSIARLSGVSSVPRKRLSDVEPKKRRGLFDEDSML